MIFSKPAAVAKLGVEYRYRVCANRSLGDLTARMKGNDQVSGYFDVEKPRFTLEQGPAWLKIDEATGVLTAPRTPGARPSRGHRHHRPEGAEAGRKHFIWGNEKVLSTSTERVGVATQKFVIEVQ